MHLSIMPIELPKHPMNTFDRYHHADHHLTADRPYAIALYRNLRRQEAPLPDIHYDFHLGLLLKGKYGVSYANAVIEIAPGEVWWTGCWEPHSGTVWEAGTTLMLITLSPKALGNIDVFGDVSWFTPFLVAPADRPRPRNGFARKIVMRLAAELATMNAPLAGEERLRVWLKIHELLLFLCQGWTPPRRSGRSGTDGAFSRILPAIERVRAGGTRAVGVDEAAKACGMSRSRFCELFRAVFGDSFGKFELRARLSGALRELGGASKPVKAIGLDWGFADNAHFAHAFKRHFGCSPSFYRAHNRQHEVGEQTFETVHNSV